MSAFQVKGATLPDGSRGDFFIDKGVFVDTASNATVIDADGLQALPGLVDLHTHLREPGFEQSETVLTGSRAAATGGFTAVFAMANTLPVADTAGVVEQVHSLGERHGYVTVRPIGAVTVGLEGQRLSEIGAMAQSRAKVRVFSDDGRCVSDALLMRRALEYVKTFGGVIAQHSQEPRLTEGAQMNEGALSGELGLAGWPAVAEEAIIARDVLLAKHVGARLHVCHVSTAGSVDVIRWAKARGIDVTAEVTPHHMLLTEQLASGYDARFKVNPPLRRDEDVLALRAALADGRSCLRDGRSRVGSERRARVGGREWPAELRRRCESALDRSGADRATRRLREAVHPRRSGQPDPLRPRGLECLQR